MERSGGHYQLVAARIVNYCSNIYSIFSHYSGAGRRLAYNYRQHVEMFSRQSPTKVYFLRVILFILRVGRIFTSIYYLAAMSKVTKSH
jgi:hypothetical protein